MGKRPSPSGALLQRIEALRLFLAGEALPNSEEMAFRLASLRARLASRPPPRHARQWTPLHSDLLLVIREVFGENAALAGAFFPGLPARLLAEKLRTLPAQASLTAAESPVARAGKGCVEELLPTPFAEDPREASLRNPNDHAAGTPDLGRGGLRRKVQWRSLRIGKPCASKPDLCALSITGASERAPRDAPPTFGGLPRFSIGGPPFEASPRCIIQRL